MRAQGHIPVRRQRKDGTNGTSVTITSTEVKYATSAQYVQPSSIAESSWSSNYPTSLSEGTWLHSRTKVTYSNGTSTLTYGSSRVGKNGADAFVVDLENQMSSIALNAEGFSVGAYDKYFKVRAYYGSTSVLNACTISESHDDSDIEVTTDAFKTTGVRVQISDETTLSAQNDITLTVTHPTYGTRTVILTLAAVKAGSGGEVYSLLSILGGITIGSNTTSATFTSTVSFYKKVGSAARAAYSCFCSVFRRKGTSYYYIANNGNSKATSWYVEGLAVSASSYDALVFCIYDTKTTVHSGYLAELEVPVYKHGDTGPNYFPSGTYDNTVEYKKTGQKTPLVFVEDESMTVWNEYAQAYGDYWYLTADTNVVGGVHYKPEDGSTYWAKAENYGVVMVGAQFARFAKNGAGVMAGDYFYSANGRIDGVERVDGVGADGNAVSASNPPAYTRFMGDPLIQNGYFNNLTGLSGPVSSDRATLQTVYLARGVKIIVSIKGKTAVNGTYGYFAIWKGANRMINTQYIYYIQRDITLEFTASEAGDYTIEYYGSTAATVATFYAFYQISGHFYPNWWVDLKTGKMCGAKDNFVIDSDGNVKVNGAMMSHKVKLLTKTSVLVTYPNHAAYEDDYYTRDGYVQMYDVESNGLPVRVYSDPDAVYYGLRNIKLNYDQVFVGVVGGSGKWVRIFLPPPHLFIGQRIDITNQGTNFPSNPNNGGVFVDMDYMYYTRTDYTEGICLTGQDAYFEDDGTGEHDSDGKNGKPYIVSVPERDGAGPIPACGIWVGETAEAINGTFFISNLVDELCINDYDWIELTAVRGYLAEKYEGTAQWETTMNYNAYWMLTRWAKKS